MSISDIPHIREDIPDKKEVEIRNLIKIWSENL